MRAKRRHLVTESVRYVTTTPPVQQQVEAPVLIMAGLAAGNTVMARALSLEASKDETADLSSQLGLPVSMLRIAHKRTLFTIAARLAVGFGAEFARSFRKGRKWASSLISILHTSSKRYCECGGRGEATHGRCRRQPLEAPSGIQRRLDVRWFK